MTRRAQVFRALSYIVLCVSSLIMIFPVLYIALGAFTTPDRFIATIFFPIPNTLNLGLIARFLSRGVWDAYVFTLARFPLAGGNDFWGSGGHGLIGQWPVLFVYGWVPPFAIFLLKQSFDMLPTEYQDAAKLDGAGLFTILFQVYGPLLKPPIVALILIKFLAVWNDYLWPSLTIPPSASFVPITMRIEGIFTRSASGLGSAGPASMMRTLLALWPPALLYFLLQRYFVQGLVASGLKG